MQQLDLILQAINQNLEPLQVIVFGSQAKGTAHKNSDLDIAIIQNEKPFLRQKSNILFALHKMDYDWSIEPDFHLFSKKDYEEKLKNQDLFVKEISKGKVVYEQ
jgi:predicted nucleotidyltransferase